LQPSCCQRESRVLIVVRRCVPKAEQLCEIVVLTN
jgi:hypothetical protein